MYGHMHCALDPSKLTKLLCVVGGMLRHAVCRHVVCCCSVAVPRKAKEAIGAIARLTATDGSGKAMTVSWHCLGARGYQPVVASECGVGAILVRILARMPRH